MQLLKIMLVGLLFLLGATNLRAQTSPNEFFLAPIQSQSIAITLNRITCIVFPVDIKPAGKGTKDVLAQKVKGTENVLIVKAARPGFAPTNLTVIGMNGRLYSLELRYEAEPGMYNYLVTDEGAYGYNLTAGHSVLFSGLAADQSTLSADADTIAGDRPFLHCSTGSERMRLVLRSIYIKDGLMWLTVKVKNHSLLDYQAEFTHFTVQDKKRMKRTAIQERVLQPVYESPEKIVSGNQFQLLVFGFRPFTIPKHKKLVLQMSEPGGGRSLMLSVNDKTVLKARAWK